MAVIPILRPTYPSDGSNLQCAITSTSADEISITHQLYICVITSDAIVFAEAKVCKTETVLLYYFFMFIFSMCHLLLKFDTEVLLSMIIQVFSSMVLVFIRM